MVDADEGAPPPPAKGAPEGGPKTGRVAWATMGTQFFRCGHDGGRGEMYAAETGSAIDSDQTGMRVLGISGYVRVQHLRQFSPCPTPKLPSLTVHGF